MTKVDKIKEAVLAKGGNDLGSGQTKPNVRDGYAVANIMISRGVNPLTIGGVHHDMDNEKAKKIVNAAEAFNNIFNNKKSAQRA